MGACANSPHAAKKPHVPGPRGHPRTVQWVVMRFILIMLEAMVSGRHTSNVDKDDSGRYFLDREGSSRWRDCLRAKS
jgi:hypothetical protein